MFNIDLGKILKFTKILEGIGLAKDQGVLSEMQRFQPPTLEIIKKFNSG
jgi:hypothetical protein